MKRSKIIIDLIRNDINIVQAMDVLKLLLLDINDKKITKWLDCEINGYSDKEKIPDYRIVDTDITGDYIVGNYLTGGLQAKNHPIPIKPEYVKELITLEIRYGISEIYQYSLQEKDENKQSIFIPVHLAYIKQASMINGEIISAHRNIGLYAFTNIIGKIKNKVLDILIELEKKYGNLDNYYIDFTNKKEKQEVAQSITNIINDNSTHIGNDNQIKSSNVGVENEN